MTMHTVKIIPNKSSFFIFIPPFPNFEALGSPHLYKLLLQLLER
jgi:hypothetical protein